MKQIIRFSISGILGFIITTALFIGMLSLLNGDKPTVTGTENNINFSFVKDFKEPKVEPPKTREKPVPEKVSQPPAMPEIAIETRVSPDVTLPTNATKSKSFNVLTEIKLPGPGGRIGPLTDNPGTIKAAIAPMYPQTALASKAEGWVKVKISVNEFGTVSAVSVIDAEPARVFNAAAKKAVRKWKFHPKTTDGKAMSFVAIQTIEFKIDQ